MLIGSAPCEGHLAFHARAVAGLENFVHAARIQPKTPFKHIDDRTGFLKSVYRGASAAGRKLNYLRDKAKSFAFGVQWRHFHGVHAAPVALQVRLARDGQRVARGFREKVAHAYPVDAGNGGKRGQRRNHAIGFKLGEQRGGKPCFGGQAGKREPLTSAQGTQLEADAVGLQRPLGVRNSLGHRRLQNNVMEVENQSTTRELANYCIAINYPEDSKTMNRAVHSFPKVIFGKLH